MKCHDTQSRAIVEKSEVSALADIEAVDLSDSDLAALISFFKLLDKWDREVQLAKAV